MPMLRRWWSERGAREKRLIAVGGSVLALVSFYTGLWSPMMAERDRLIAEVPRLRASARAMELQAQEIGRLRAAARKGPADLKAVLERSARENGFDAAALRISADRGRARVGGEALTPESWLRWIAVLQSEHAIRIETMTMQPAGPAGGFRIDATFSVTE